MRRILSYDHSTWSAKLLLGVLISGMWIAFAPAVFSLSASTITLGDPRSSETAVTYTFDSDGWDTVTVLNCVQLVFSINADGTGGVPGGMDTTLSDFLVGSTALTHGSWTETFTANGTLELTAGAEAILATPGDLVFDGITNANTEDTFFATVTTYTNIDCSTGPTDSVVVAFALKDGTPVTLTIDPTLTFTCAGVASGSVNGETITHTSAGASIDYLDDVNVTTNGVSAHDLQITTNASGGYTVNIRHTSLLTNAASDTITAHTGTNLSPTTLAVGAERWGYTTEDATLKVVGDGADRFTNPGNEWAGFTTSNEEVIYNAAAPVGTETIRVGHQVAVDNNTETGTYTSAIIYTIVPIF